MVTVEMIIKHFGSRRALAERLGCKPQALTRWSNGVPPGAAIEIEKLTKGKFKAVDIPSSLGKTAKVPAY